MDKKLKKKLQERGDRYVDSTENTTFKLNQGKISPEIAKIVKEINSD